MSRKLSHIGTLKPITRIGMTAAERSVKAKPAADSYMMLAKAMHVQYLAAKDEEAALPNMEKAESAIRSAIRLTKAPGVDMYLRFGEVLFDREKFGESRAAYLKAYELARPLEKLPGGHEAARPAILGLIATNESLRVLAESDRWFQALVKVRASSFDWADQAKRQYQRREFKTAGASYLRAGELLEDPDGFRLARYICAAADAYMTDGTEPDRTLETSRSCIEKVGTSPFFAPVRARSHFAIANILNDRGIYEEALRHAKEATEIDPGDAFAWQERAESLTRLGQAKEAIAAAKEAIRLSDGKYGHMHFTLGAALFDAHDFRAARQSFEKAAELA